MTSLFFNISDTRYKVSNPASEIKKVDISSGLLFFDIALSKHQDKSLDVKNPDKLVAIVIVKSGNITILDRQSKKTHTLVTNNIYLFCSSKQDLLLTAEKSDKSDIFVLFVADFILKRYLSSKPKEPIDFLYHQLQIVNPLTLINTQPIDALTLYLVNKIKKTDESAIMQSFLGEHRVIEFLLHHFSLLDILDEKIDEITLNIAKRAKTQLLKTFISPPTIPELAHLCATNESKLKSSFKKTYKITLYAYIQKLRLEKANILLKEETLSIGEIAKKVGYKHQGNFSKLFFKTYGVYPKELKT